jgi:HEPN domain-containing protein
MDWKTQLNNELQMAYAARAVENEGKTRVCARRAAGVAIREYLSRNGITPPSISAYDLLKFLEEMDETPADLRQATAYLRLRVTEEFRLPVNVDLVAEAKKICTVLLPEWEEAGG